MREQSSSRGLTQVSLIARPYYIKPALVTFRGDPKHPRNVRLFRFDERHVILGELMDGVAHVGFPVLVAADCLALPGFVLVKHIARLHRGVATE
jgi:hypothetical protein